MTKTLFIKKIYTLVSFSIFIVLFSCSENSTEPEKDTQIPVVSIVSPVTNSVLTDTVTIQVNATDNSGVSKVEFYIDNVKQFNADDFAEPFEYFWDLSSSQIGDIHTIFVKAYDEAGNIGISDTIRIYYKWILLFQDENENFPRDINKLFVRSSTTNIEFRVEMNGNWDDPHNLEGGIDCAIFLDTDQNPNTGFKPDTSYCYYQVNVIGADFVVVIGYEGDSLWSWNSVDTTWESFEDFNYLNLSNNSNYFEVGINLTDLGNPSKIDIVSANITFESDSTYWDWAPNENHLTYEIDGLYLGKTNIQLNKNQFIQPIYEKKNQYYFKRKK